MASTVLAAMAERAAVERTVREADALAAALHAVIDGRIEWRKLGDSKHAQRGFTRAGGVTLNDDLGVLIALWQLRKKKLICLDGQAVKVTLAGERHLLAEAGGGRLG